MQAQDNYLKKEINIPININEKARVFLMIELCEKGISLVWHSLHPKEIAGAEVYNFEEKDNVEEVLSGIFTNILNSKYHPEQIRISYNYKQSLLVPEKYYQSSTNADMLNLLYLDSHSDIVKFDHIPELEMYHIYRVPKKINDLVLSMLPNGVNFHSTSKQILMNKEDEGSHLLCIVFYHRIKVILFKEGILQIVQQFEYNTPEDVAYYLLNVCEQYHVNSTEVKLRLQGLIVKDSKLYEYLYNYFLQIDLALASSKVSLTPHFVHQTKYFLSHLIDLATCE